MEAESKITVTQENIGSQKDLECSICGDIFDKAVSLKACGHTYCSVCIRNHWVTTSRPGIHHQSKKECPLCRTAIGNDVNKALIINREIQQAVKAFKPVSLLLSSSAKIGSYQNESPIKKRMQSRNYAGMQKNGRKELQRVCNEYNLPSSGNEQELVGRLRYFECMWNAELDTIDTPLRPSELVVKFKKKERTQREEKSRDIMTGKINHSKYMKKLTSSLLDDGNKRNDKTVSATTSGNVLFDVKFKSNFSALIAEGRNRMKKQSYWSSPCKDAGLRTYDDDGIHDDPKRNNDGSVSCHNNSEIETYATTDTVHFLERTYGDESAKIESSVGNQFLQKKKNHVNNPYQSEQDPSISDMTSNKQQLGTLGRHTPNVSTARMTTSAQLKPSQSPKRRTIYNPYKKKQLQQHQTPSPNSIASHHVTSGNFDSGPMASLVSSKRNICQSQSSDKKCQDRTPLAQANNMITPTNIHRRKIGESKIPGIRSIDIGISSDDVETTKTTPTQKKHILYNPYKTSGRRNR